MLLKKHVDWIRQGTASQVDYAGFQTDRVKLNTYLQNLSQVRQAQFDVWSRDQQLAFLINAYNAFTVELILSRYPALDSIKDLGSLLKSPWKRKFFTLFGKQRHLDYIEHDLIRKHYSEPRIHFAVVCASIGCPGLRDEAFTASQLNRQLDDSVRRFLADRSRNRYDTENQKLLVSEIFKWFKKDFDGQGGFDSIEAFFASYADVLSTDESTRHRISSGKIQICYLDYDWRLNDTRTN